MSLNPENDYPELELWHNSPQPTDPAPVPQADANHEKQSPIVPNSATETREQPEDLERRQSYSPLDFARKHAGIGDTATAGADWPSASEAGANPEEQEPLDDGAVSPSDEAHDAALEDWKADLREDFERWLDH